MAVAFTLALDESGKFSDSDYVLVVGVLLFAINELKNVFQEME